MAKKWSDVAASSAFQALSFDEQEEARRQYFESVVAPQVGSDELEVVREQFFADTSPISVPDATLHEAEFVTPSRSRGGVAREFDRAATARAEFAKTDPRRVDLPFQPAPGGSILDRPAPADMQEDLRRGNEQWDMVPPARQEAIRQKLAKPVERVPELKAAPERGLVDRALDSTLRKPLDNSLAGLLVEGAGDAARGTIMAGQGLGGSSLWSGISAAARTVGADGLADMAQMSGAAAREAQSQTANPLDRDSLTQAVFQSTFQSVPLVALGGAALPAMMATAAADEYGRRIDRGATHEAALERAAVMGVAEGLGERISLPALMKVVSQTTGRITSKEFGRMVADLAVKEQVGEQATLALQNAYEKFGAQGIRKDMTLADYVADMVETAKVTLGQSVLTAGMGAGLRKISGAQPNGPQPAAPVPTARDLAVSRGFLFNESPRLESFTPPDSPTAKAGLKPIVVPVPPRDLSQFVDPALEQELGLGALRMGGANARVSDVPGGLAGRGGAAGGGDAVGGLAGAGRDTADAGARGADAGGTLAGDAEGAAVGGPAGQQPAPVKIWAGRAGDGYALEQDASQALPGLQRKYPDLSWSLQRDGEGKFFWSGTTRDNQVSQGVDLGATQTQQTQPGTAQGQAAQAGFGAAAAAGATVPQNGDADQPAAGLKLPDNVPFKLAPEAPIRAFQSVRAALQKESNLDIAMVPRSDWTDDQKLGAMAARFLGKTYTVYRYNGGNRAEMPNGFVERLGGKHIMVAEDTDSSPLSVAFHEGLHALPDDIRTKAEDALLAEFKAENLGKFKAQFKLNNVSDDVLRAEIPAYMAQAISQRQDFVEQLRDKLGNREFAEFAKLVVQKIDQIIRGFKNEYGDDFVNKYIRNYEVARNALTDAYSQAMKAQGVQPDSDIVAPVASNRAADVNSLGLYSELARKIEAGPNQAMPDQWKGYIRGLTTKGVKPDEIEWSGVEDFIELKRASGQKVTKAEVAEYLKQGGVQVEETVLGGGRAVEDSSTGRTILLRGEAKYGQYTLPGGENYREVLLTLPTQDQRIAAAVERARLTDGEAARYRELDALSRRNEASEAELAELSRLEARKEESQQAYARARAADGRRDYTSTHWGQRNVLAHIRVNDRTDADGNKVLFVEELQSDWGQQGKRDGFAKLVKVDTSGWTATENWPGSWRVLQANGEPANNGVRAESAKEAISSVAEMWERRSRDGIPLAPFVNKTEGWLNLALKRVMTMAVEGGYDRVAFVNGEQSAERYDLSKQVSSISWTHTKDGTYNIEADTNRGEPIVRKGLTASELENTVGKEVAQKIVDGVGAFENDRAPMKRGTLSGVDLKVGGEGMKAFYDTIVPLAIKKLLPKVGGGQLTQSVIDVQGRPETGTGLQERREYQGPTLGVFEIREAADKPDLPAAISAQLNEVADLVRRGQSIEAAMEQAGSIAAARAIGGDMVPLREVRRKQLSFDVTPAMREKVSGGLPMFSRRTQGDQAQAPAPRRGTERVGDFDVRTMKDGSIVVYGDPEAIRAQIPDDVKGRVTKDGIVFTTSAAPRVKGALEGSKTAYSRGGAVLEKLPMKDGKYVGAPEKFNTPAKIPHLRKWLRQLADEGAPGRYWYENSGREVLKMVGGNVQEARKFVALLAIYSPQAKVDANSTFALRAWAQYKAGHPISVKTEVMDRKARAAMDDVDAFWSGEKTGNFYTNLLREIDPATEGKQGATIDMWMMRAGQYDSDAPTSTQYAFMEHETNRLAAELGWEPQQVQAAIWVAMKARMENHDVGRRTEALSEKKGWIRFDYPIKKGKKVKTRVILNEKEHRANWLRHAIAHDPTTDDTQAAKFDFSDGLRRHIGQISWEARPGRSTGVLPGVNDAPYEQQVEFQQAVQRALLDDDGVDLLARKLGLLVDGEDLLAPGVWQGEIAAGMQKLVAMAPTKGGDPIIYDSEQLKELTEEEAAAIDPDWRNGWRIRKTQVDPAQLRAIDTYASMLGLLLRQEGVGYHRPFYNSSKKAANGVNLDVGRSLTQDEARALWAALDERMRAAGVENWEDGAGMISAPSGMRVVNFGALQDNNKFRKLVKDAASTLAFEELATDDFASDGALVSNDWKESSNGENYRSRISAAGSPDLLGWARDFLAPRVQAVFDEYSQKYGWGDPGQIRFSRRAGSDAAGSGRDRSLGQEEVRRQVTPSYGKPREGSSSAVGYHYSQQPRTTLSSAMYGAGLRGAEMARLEGADPRLKQRVYFYIDRGTGINPEAGVGGYAHRVRLENLYDADEDALRLSRDSASFNGFEAAVLDAGFDGYMVRDAGPSGNAVLLGPHAVPVEQLGSQSRMTTEAPVPPARDRVLSDAEKIAANKLLPAGQVTGKRWSELVSRAMPEIYERLADHPVWQSDKVMYRNELAKALRSEQPVFSKRVTDTPEFKAWFGDSKIVDESGQPLVMYHGTGDSLHIISNMRGAIYFSPDPEFARDFAESAAASIEDNGGYDEEEYGPMESAGANIIPVYLSVQNPFDPRNVKHIDQLLDAAGYTGSKRREWSKLLAAGMYDSLEPFYELMKSNGFDGFYEKEQDSQDFWNVGVFSETQIKSATGNNGQFDPTNPDIRYSKRAGKARDSWLVGRDEAGRFTLGLGVKAYDGVALLASKVLDKLKLKPISTELGRSIRKMKVQIEKSQALTADVAKRLQVLTEDERQLISDVIEREVKAGVTPPQRVLSIAASMSQIMSEQSAELVRLGMLDADTAKRLDGKYLPRFYEKDFKNEVKQWADAARALLGRKKAMQGIGGKHLKARGLWKEIAAEELPDWEAQGWEQRDQNYQAGDETVWVWRDYTRDEREQMGEIRDAMFRFVMGYMQSQKDIALGRLYESLAQSVAKRKPVDDTWVQVPTTTISDESQVRRYGKLAGKWVPAEVMDHLADQDRSFDNELLQLYRKGLSLWKEGKVVLNPVSHANNIISNLTAAHFAGVSYWHGHKYAGAMRDLVKGDPMVEEAREAGLFVGSFSREELLKNMPEQMRMLAGMTESAAKKGARHVWNALSMFLRKPAAVAYDAEDKFFRYLIYRDARKNGLAPDDAVDYAQKYIFTYDDLPKGARIIRDTALPFFSYTYKAIPMLAETLVTKPWRYAAPAAVVYGANTLFYALAQAMDDDDDDALVEVIKRYFTDDEFRARVKGKEAEEEKNLPPWMQGYSMVLGVKKTVRLGTDDVTGLPMFLDVSRWLPGGDIFDTQANAGGLPLPQPFTPNHPILTIFTGLIGNRDLFTGDDLVDKDADTTGEKVSKWGSWMWRQMAPAVAVGNYHFERNMNAVADIVGKPIQLKAGDEVIKEYTGIDKGGLPVQPGLSALQTFGVKARPIDLELSDKIEASKRRQLIRELEARVKGIKRQESRGSVSSEAAETQIEYQRTKILRLREGLDVDGDSID